MSRRKLKLVFLECLLEAPSWRTTLDGASGGQTCWFNEFESHVWGKLQIEIRLGDQSASAGVCKLYSQAQRRHDISKVIMRSCMKVCMYEGLRYAGSHHHKTPPSRERIMHANRGHGVTCRDTNSVKQNQNHYSEKDEKCSALGDIHCLRGSFTSIYIMLSCGIYLFIYFSW